jgi:hypothetical protein
MLAAASDTEPLVDVELSSARPAALQQDDHRRWD